MAMAQQEKRNRTATPPVQSMITSQMEDLLRLAHHVRENPWMYAGSAAFIVLCIIAGILFRINAMIQHREAATQYAAALSAEDPAQQVAELESVTASKNPFADEALYVMGEAAIRAGDPAKAESAFQRVQQEFPSSPYVPVAAEGLGFLAANAGDYAAALARYEEVLQKWPNSFTGRRQPYNIGQMHEKLGNHAAAIEAYESQQTMFPDSRIAQKAQMELARLRQSHPALFPEETPPVAALDAAEPAAEAPASVEPVAEETPAEPAAEEAPAESETVPES